jgi:hypothetical protein
MTKPTIPEAIPLLREFANAPGNGVGGSLHIVLEDGNVKDSDVASCIEYARQRGDDLGVKVGELLLSMSTTQRRKVSARFYDLMS